MVEECDRPRLAGLSITVGRQRMFNGKNRLASMQYWGLQSESSAAEVTVVVFITVARFSNFEAFWHCFDNVKLTIQLKDHATVSA